MFALTISILQPCAQNLAPNPSFEEGTDIPASWDKSSGSHAWESFGHTGQRSVSVTAAGACGTEWRTASCSLEAGQPYLFRFWGMATNAPGIKEAFISYGYAVNRYFSLSPEWKQYGFVGVLPNNLSIPLLRFGQCPVNGSLIFDDIEVKKVTPVHKAQEELLLGAGESFRAGRYMFKSQYSSFGGNASRCLVSHSSSFDTARWSMTGGSSFTYRHGFEGLPFSSAQITATIDYSQSGSLVAQVSTNGHEWREAGRFTPLFVGYFTTNFQVNVPEDLLPSEALFIRISSTGSMWVRDYVFNALVPEGPSYADGATIFMEQSMPDSPLQPLAVIDTPQGFALRVSLVNSEPLARELGVYSESQGPAGIRTATSRMQAVPGITNIYDLLLPTAGAGDNVVRIQVLDLSTETVLTATELGVTISPIRDSSYGHLLSIGEATNCSLWWCEATYKVGRVRPPPQSNPTPNVQFAAARNEYESFQLVLRPDTTLTNLHVEVEDFVHTDNSSIKLDRTNFQCSLVEYVPVTEPTDYSGAIGDHPDPLVPLSDSFTAMGQKNQPLLITCLVPKGAVSGRYTGKVIITNATIRIETPVELRVFDFALSDVTHTKNPYGVYLSPRWHYLSNSQETEAVWDLYMQACLKYRITPYSPDSYAPIGWYFSGQSFTFNFAAFDRAMERYLDEFGFNCFRFDIVPERLGIHFRFTPEYKKLYADMMKPIMAHLREKGWLEKTYCYWFDEPAPAHYPFVAEGMRTIGQCAPGLKRILTVNPDPVFDNLVDIWVPLLSGVHYFQQRVQTRQFAGDEFWWYVCTDPDAPSPNNFIDHPALNSRIRFWMAEKLGVEGELYWNTGYVRPGQNPPSSPWDDAMSWHHDGWPLGNGDGLLFYPPSRTLPVEGVQGPFSSLRLEAIRDGIEDREYFWLLKEVLLKALRRGIGTSAVQEGYQAYHSVLALTTNNQIFTRDPQQIYAVRERIAEAIEALDDGEPMIVKNPTPRSVSVGDSITLRSEALGWPLPSYQWMRNKIPVTGATNATLLLENLQLSEQGVYSVLVQNTKGTEISDECQIAVLATAGVPQPPTILSHPENQVIVAKGDAVLSVTAVSTTPLTYTWYFNGARMPSQTNAAFSITNVSAAVLGTYTVAVSNAHGGVLSKPAHLKFRSAPILKATRAENNSGLLLCYSPQGQASTILVSTNLVDWSVLSPVLPTSEQVVVLDTETKTHPRFYRVQLE